MHSVGGVLFLSIGASGRDRTISDCAFLVDSETPVTILTAQRDDWPESMSSKITWIEIAPLEQSRLLLRVERFLVFKVARIPFRLARKTASVANRFLGGRADRLVGLAEAGLDHHRDIAVRFHRGPFARCYKSVRPYLLWRLVRRSRVLDRLRDSEIERVVISDMESVAIGWHVARRRPDLACTFYLDRAVVLPR